MRVETFHLDRQFDRTLRRVVSVEDDHARDIVKAAIGVRNAEVLHAKEHEGMNRIDLKRVGRVCGKKKSPHKCEGEDE